MKMSIELYSGTYGLDFKTVDQFIKDGLIIVDDQWEIDVEQTQRKISSEIQRLKRERLPKEIPFVRKSLEVQLIFIKAWSLQAKNLES